MNGDDVQKARNIFIGRLARSSEDWIGEFVELLDSYI